MSCYTTCILNNDAILYPIADPQPVVECSFFTEFEDHIFVAMDIELLLFLKNVIMSYVKEKDKGVCDREATKGTMQHITSRLARKKNGILPRVLYSSDCCDKHTIIVDGQFQSSLISCGAILTVVESSTDLFKPADGKSGASSPPAPDTDTTKKNITNPTTVLKQDFRHFQCNTWILEPTVRLIAWGGKRLLAGDLPAGGGTRTVSAL